MRKSGLHEAAVELHGHPERRRLAEVHVRRVVQRVVVHHRHPIRHPWVADQFRQLFAEIRTVQAGGHQHGDVRSVDAGHEHGLDQGPQEQTVRHRAGDIADQDAGRSLALGEFGERRRTHADIQSGSDGSGRIRHQRHGRFGNDRHVQIVVETDGQAGLAVQEINNHGAEDMPGRRRAHGPLLSKKRSRLSRIRPTPADGACFDGHPDQLPTSPDPVAHGHIGFIV